MALSSGAERPPESTAPLGERRPSLVRRVSLLLRQDYVVGGPKRKTGPPDLRGASGGAGRMTSAVGEQQRRLWSSIGSGVSYGDIKGTEDWVQVVASYPRPGGA